VQNDVTFAMRGVLVEWMNEVAIEYNVTRHTFFLAVNYLDRFLSSFAIARTRLQLVGMAALLIATKYEEIMPLLVEQVSYISEYTFTREALLRMEVVMLKTLNYELAAPTCWEFAHSFAIVAELDAKTRLLAQVRSLHTGFFLCFWHAAPCPM
jgi:cyclin-A